MVCVRSLTFMSAFLLIAGAASAQTPSSAPAHSTTDDPRNKSK